MNSYKLEDIEKLATDAGMRTCIHNDHVDVFLGDFRVGVFKKIFKGVSLYELVWTYTKVSEYHTYFHVHINIHGIVAGKQFFGDLYTVYKNMSKKYKELLKTIKAAEIKNCGTEFDI